ncbi:hypothetical protein V6N13_143170 [Hibiscus sabdariffa]|uniref:Uncharacterized protein n=1 Tax=Hibiscus sabdariffa TaxID=183260 RepID=A0ABR2FGH0_9ROSI
MMDFGIEPDELTLVNVVSACALKVEIYVVKLLKRGLELLETKYNLEKAREESMLMANCLCALKQELERTKRQVEQMKEGEIEKVMMEDVKFKIVPGSAG